MKKIFVITTVSLVTLGFLVCRHNSTKENGKVVKPKKVKDYNDFQQLIKDTGYVPLKISNTVYKRGSVIQIKDNNYFDGDHICQQTDSIGVISNKIGTQLESGSADMYLSQQLKGEFDFTAKFKSILDTNVSFNGVKSIKVNFSNVKVKILPLSLVIERIDTYVRKKSCQKAINKNIKNNLTMINGVIQADAVYSVEFREETKAGIMANILNKLNFSLKLGKLNDSKSKIEGKSLYWGVKHNPTWLDNTIDPKKYLIKAKYTYKPANSWKEKWVKSGDVFTRWHKGGGCMMSKFGGSSSEKRPDVARCTLLPGGKLQAKVRDSCVKHPDYSPIIDFKEGACTEVGQKGWKSICCFVR